MQEQHLRDTGQLPDVLFAAFYVLTLDHTPESVGIALRVPATVADALHAVDTARDYVMGLRFSQLHEVRPQPFGDKGVLIAVPARACSLF